jgi:hypothetical protein
MFELFRASIVAGTTAVASFWIIMFIRDPITELSKNMLFGVASASLMIWILGSIFAFFLLIPLHLVLKHCTKAFSLIIFIGLGCIFPALLMGLFSIIPAHGETPPLYQEDNRNVILGILSMGLVGALSSFSAWRSLKQSYSNECT